MTDKSDKPEVIDSDCLEAFDHLYAYINGELKEADSVAMIEHHLSHCKSCFTRAQIEKKINDRLKKSKQDKTPDSLKNRLDQLIDDFEDN